MLNKNNLALTKNSQYKWLLATEKFYIRILIVDYIN